ncbi:MAG: DUF1631 domain-containing protein [Gammaproteobacteria bacterium]|nr:DUF1631 domain-containing protein [Gammaproteobacteria bacterium]
MAQPDTNVVSFAKKSAADPLNHRLQTHKLIERSEELAVNLLSAVMQRMFDNADDTLFKMTEKADKTNEQSSYFDSMRLVRLKRQAIASNFIDLINKNFRNLLSAKKTTQVSFADLSMDQMSLVEESDLEETIAVKNMITKILYQYSEEITALQQRLAYLLPEAKINDETNPLGPKAICEAFMQATKKLEVDIKASLIVLKLFENHIITGLKPLYDTVNQMLIDANVLPVIRPSINKTHEHGTATATSHPGTATTAITAATDDMSMSYLHRLMTHYRQINVGPEHGFGPRPTGTTEIPWTEEMIARSSQALTSVLSTLQLNPGLVSNNNPGSTLSAASGLREYVISQMQRHGQEAHALNPLDNDIIDIVSMLFEYILDDAIIPDAAKALLGKLQIPMLKAAILDKHFFASKGHPARTLLNEMAKATVALSNSDAEHATSLLAEIKRIVDTITQEFTDDQTLFERLLREFQNFMELLTFQESEVHQQVAKIIKQKEDSALANKWVDESLKEILQTRQLPTPVEAIITGAWKQVMLKTYLSSGLESDTWKSQVRFIEILDWSIKPKRITVDRAKLASIIYLLVNTLRNGLKTIGLAPDEIVQVLTQLEPYHVASIKGVQLENNRMAANVMATPPTNPQQESGYNLSVEEITGAIKQIETEIAALQDIEPAPIDQSGVYDKSLMEDIVLSGWNVDDHKPEEQPQDEYLELARHLEQGRWVEFTGKNNRKVRAKLAFKSELLGEYTFLDWKYKVVADKTLYGLAADLRRGSATIVNDVPLLDRALDAVMHTLSGSGKK